MLRPVPPVKQLARSSVHGRVGATAPSPNTITSTTTTISASMYIASRALCTGGETICNGEIHFFRRVRATGGTVTLL